MVAPVASSPPLRAPGSFKPSMIRCTAQVSCSPPRQATRDGSEDARGAPRRGEADVAGANFRSGSLHFTHDVHGRGLGEDGGERRPRRRG